MDGTFPVSLEIFLIEAQRAIRWGDKLGAREQHGDIEFLLAGRAGIGQTGADIRRLPVFIDKVIFAIPYPPLAVIIREQEIGIVLAVVVVLDNIYCRMISRR